MYLYLTQLNLIQEVSSIYFHRWVAWSYPSCKTVSVTGCAWWWPTSLTCCPWPHWCCPKAQSDFTLAQHWWASTRDSWPASLCHTAERCVTPSSAARSLQYSTCSTTPVTCAWPCCTQSPLIGDCPCCSPRFCRFSMLRSCSRYLRNIPILIFLLF